MSETSQESEYKHSLNFTFDGYTFAYIWQHTYMYVAIEMKLMHRFDYHFKVHNFRVPPNIPQSYIEICATAQECITRHTDKHRHWSPQYISRCYAYTIM